MHAIYRRLYEGIPYGKLELLARGLSQRRALRRRAADAHPSDAPTTTRATGADENYSEGVVDHLRSVEGTAVAGLVRDLLGDGEQRAQGVAARHRRPRRRLAIARAQGGGGHRHAAGFSTDLRLARSWSSSCGRSLAEQLLSRRRRSSSVDKPAGITSHDVVAARAAAARHAASRSATPARSTRSRPGLLLVLVGRATRVQRFLMALPKRYETVARLGCDVDHRRPRGRDRAGPHAAPSRSCCRPGEIRQRPPAYSAVKVGGERAYALARARGGRSSSPSAR